MKNKIVKFLVRTALLLLITLVIVITLVVQPVFSDTDYKKALAKPNTLKNYVITLSDTLHKETPIANLLDAKVEFVFNQVSKLHDDVSYQLYDVMGVEYNNVVVKYKGEKNCGTYVIGAHFDTYGNLPGADDNSSGTAGLIELARLFAQNKPTCDLQLAFYNLEEPPYFRSEHMGSYVHAKNLKDNNVPVEMMISLEMIGYFSDEPNSQGFPVPAMEYIYSSRGNFISIVADLSQMGITRFLKKHMLSATDLPVFSTNAPRFIQGIDFSDHLNYWNFGYPAVMITDTAFNRNKNYHTKHDTAEKLDYVRMAKVVDGVYYAINAHMQK